MRPIDFCTPKPLQLEHPCFVASQRSDPSRRERPCSALVPGSIALIPSLPARARSRENVFFSRSRFARPKTCEAGTGGSGPHDANETGEDRGSQRDPRFDGHASAARGRSLPSRARRVAASDTPVASSALVGVGRDAYPRRGSEAAETGSAGPCERRALSRSEVPSIVRCAVQPDGTEVPPNPLRTGRSRDVHVMRIAALRPAAPFHQEQDVALTRAVHARG